MRTSVDLNSVSTIKARLGIQNGGKVHKFFTSTCYRYMSRFVPGGDTGLLNQNVRLETDSITYESPYAHYQYIGKLYVDPVTGSSWARKGVTKVATNKDLKYHTPGTGSYWDKKMWTSKGDEVIKEVQAYADRGCK